MRTRHYIIPGDNITPPPCYYCEKSYCPEAVYCDQIISIITLPKENDERYSLIENEDRHYEIYHNGKHVYQDISDHMALDYFKRLFKLYQYRRPVFI